MRAERSSQVRRGTGCASRQRQALAALLLAPAVFGASLAHAQATLTNETMNFETGYVSWSATCHDTFRVQYRYASADGWSTYYVPTGSGFSTTVSAITNRDYVEARVLLDPDSGCTGIDGTTISYTATTLASSPASLSDTNLNTATLTVTLGDDELERTGATSPRTWASGAAASHFSLASEAITGLSISSVTGIATGGRTATVTLAFSGEVSAGATVMVQVAAAAHSGANDITSRPASVAASPGFSISESSLLLDEDPGAVKANRGAYEVQINTQPASSCASGVVLTIASDNADVTASPSTLTFTNSDYVGARRVTVLAARDGDSSTDSATLSHSVTTACTPDYPTGMTVNSVSVTARDDDRRLVVTPAELAVEEGSTGSYTVALGGSPAAGATVTVTATSANPAVRVDSDGTPTTRVLTFTDANWNTAQTVTVTAASDSDATDEFSTIANAPAEAVWQPFDVTVRVADDEETGTDYDTDDDGLIEIATLAHLNAVRWDLDGDGAVDSATNATSYGNAFPNAAADMGCPDGPDDDQSADCVGYELAAKLDFDTDGDGDVDADDTGSYANWSPIGGSYSGVFDGNGRTISRLTVSTSGKAGLFNTVTGTVRRLGLVDASIRTTGATNAGALAADVGTLGNPGQVIACWSSGTVTGTTAGPLVDHGGLVGVLADENSRLVASFSSATVSSLSNTGGLAGAVRDYATIIASYGTGATTGGRAGGLLGAAFQGTFGDTTVRASYAIGRPTGAGAAPRLGGLIGSITGDVRSIDLYFDSTTTARTSGAGRGTSGTAQTTSELQTPTSATGIYANWDDLDIDGDGVAVEDPWDFGSGTQYPVLSYAGLDTALQFNSQGTNSAPSFGSGSVSNQAYRQNHPISQLQVPAASSGNGALAYTAYGLPAGLSFDGDGSGACSQARTICGSPTTVGSSTVRIVATDQDDTDASDRDALTFTVNVVNPSARITATNPSPLVEGTLNNATVTVTLANTTFASGVTASSFSLGTVVPGLRIASVAPVSSGDTTATLTLGYDGTNFDDQRLFGVTVAAAAHALAGDLSTGLVDLFPTRGVTLSASSLLVPENGNADYTVRLASIPFGGDVTVAITGAGSGLSASPTSLVFTALNWNTVRPVRVSAVEDGNPTNEMVTLTHTPAGGGYAGVAAATLQVTATDNDAPSLLVSPAQLRVREAGSATYAIRLNTQPTASVTVTVAGAAGAVTVDTDAATGNQNTLTFTQTTWNTNQTVTVAAGEDDNASDETLTLQHTATGGGYGSLPAGSRPGVTVSVDDDDTPAILIDANPATTNMDEPGPLALNEMSGHSANALAYTVRLATEPTAAVAVEISSGDRAVTVDNDGTPRTRTLTFTTTNWDTAQTVAATAVEDDDASNERVAISHAATGGDYEGVAAELIATTVDDDEPAVVLNESLTTGGVEEGATAMYEVRLQTEPAGTVRVTATASVGVEVDMDPAQAGRQPWLRFDAANWNTARTVVVRALHDDDGANGMATIRHVASGADYGPAPAAEIAFTIRDDDSLGIVLTSDEGRAVNEGSSWVYHVDLETAPVGGTVRVSATSSDEAVATVSPSTLTFGASDWNVPKRVRVQGVDGGSATLSHAASGADYDGQGVSNSLTVTVRDTDAPGVRLEPTAVNVLEEGAAASYRIRLNTQPSGNVLVTPSAGAFAPELAVSGDGVALTFTTTDWDQEQTVSLEVRHDGDAEHETMSVTHAVSGYAGVSSAPSLVVMVGDDEAAALRFEPAGGISVREGAAAGAYTVALASQPTAPATVTVSSDDAGLTFDADDGVPGDQDSLTFDSSNWATARTVAVRPVADADAATDEATLLHTVAGGGWRYDELSAGYPVRVSDADAAPAPSRVSASAAGRTSLAVSWSASPGARGYWVQWRRPGESWHPERLLEVGAGATSARIDGLETGVRYEVRVIGLNRGDPGDPSAVETAVPTVPTLANRPPAATGRLPAEVGLAPEETRALNLAAAFSDPDGDALTYTAWSSNRSVATAWAAGDELRLRAVGVGTAEVTVVAADPADLTARVRLRVVVGIALSLADASAPEGGTARLVAELSVSRAVATTFGWRVGADQDSATADADAGEHGDAAGEATIPAGETRTTIEIPIADDEDVEPAREWFEVALSAPADGCCVLRRARALVAVREGVCDRTPAVRDALRGSEACDAPTPAALAALTRLSLAGSGAGELRTGDFQGLTALRTLDLSGNALTALPPGLFAGLGTLRELDLSANALAALQPAPFAAVPRLRTLDLSANGFAALPPGLFAGLGNLREASLEGNPGAPFALAVELARTDAEPGASGPATVEARFAAGAPFALRLPLAVEPATAEGLPATVSIAAGATAGTPFAIPEPPVGALRLQVGAPTLPPASCGAEWPFRACFRGFAPMAGPALMLFRQPPRALPAPQPAPLAGDDLRLPLASLVAAGDAPGALRFEASSSDESVATARVVGRDLLVEPEPGAEGTVEIVVVATDSAGLAATLRFEVRVEFFAPTRQAAGWRSALPTVAPP